VLGKHGVCNEVGSPAEMHHSKWLLPTKMRHRNYFSLTADFTVNLCLGV